ncbi:hypothetical protein [Geminisphaera colitermitum]|nr:hypothetical protein [Geminisphaera colitermitum]
MSVSFFAEHPPATKPSSAAIGVTLCPRCPPPSPPLSQLFLT